MADVVASVVNGVVVDHVDTDRVFACRARAGLFVMVMRGKGLGAHVPALSSVWNHDVLGARLAYLLVIDPRSPRDVPDDGFRTGAAALLKKPHGDVVVGAAVVPVEGFVGATVRGVLTGLSWMSGGTQQVFSSVEAAAAVIAAAGIDVAADVVIADVEALRARLG